jgi:hypothetical protein
MKRERWGSNLPVVWNAVPARSPASMALSNGNTPGVDLVYNIDLDKYFLIYICSKIYEINFSKEIVLP